MNKLFIIESADDLYMEAASLIDSYVVDAVAGDQLNDAEAELKKLQKQINKAIIATVALSVLFKAIYSAVKQNKSIKASPDESGLSPSGKKKIINRKQQMEDVKGLDSMLQQLAEQGASLKKQKADNAAMLAEMKADREKRSKIINSMGLTNDPDMKKVLAEKDKKLKKSINDSKKAISTSSKSFRDNSTYAKKMVGAYGDEADVAKFEKLSKEFK